MSTKAKLTLVASCVTAFGIVAYIHFQQKVDRDNLHDGVIRDVQRQQQRKIENTYQLQQQIELTKQLTKLQEEKDVLSK